MFYINVKVAALKGTYTCMIHNSEIPEQNDAMSGNMIVYKPPAMTSLHQVSESAQCTL